MLSGMCHEVQFTISLANTQPVLLFVADLKAPLAHGICLCQTSVIDLQEPKQHRGHMAIAFALPYFPILPPYALPLLHFIAQVLN